MATAIYARSVLRSAGALALLAALLAVLAPDPGPAEGAFPGANGKIAFSSDREGDVEIFHMNPDGSGQINLVNDMAGTAADTGPSYSPNGAKIAFYSNPDGNNDIYTMNADGSGVSAALTSAGDNYKPAHCGTMIAFVSDRDSGNTEVYTMNADGSSQTNRSTNAAVDSQPAWSPDCSMIAFMSLRDGNQEIYTMNANGTNQLNRSMNAAIDDSPNWSPDGLMIAFGSTRDGDPEIYTMNADGSSQTNRTMNAVSDYTPAWSPDGSMIAFSSTRDGNFEIYTMNANGSSQLNRSMNAAMDFYPDWQPNPDADGDGLLPPDDACPLLAGPASNQGCPPPGPPAVGGIVGLRDGSAGPASRGSDAPAGDYAAPVAAALAGLAAIIAGAWYARRRWLR